MSEPTLIELLEEEAHEADNDAVLHEAPHHTQRAARLRAAAARLREEMERADVSAQAPDRGGPYGADEIRPSDTAAEILDVLERINNGPAPKGTPVEDMTKLGTNFPTPAPCPTCGGSGWTPDNVLGRVDCPTCNGTGYPAEPETKR